jgi:ABC transporter substrate binding protein
MGDAPTAAEQPCRSGRGLKLRHKDRALGEPLLQERRAISTIPIVFSSGVNPIAAGLVSSLNRPDRNATGISLLSTTLNPKNLELLHELVPKAGTVALLFNQVPVDLSSVANRLNSHVSILFHIRILV